MEKTLSVRELSASDIPHIIRYWLSADDAYLLGMGVDLAKMPDEAQWQSMLSAQLTQDYPQKQSYGIILEVDGAPIGHSNVNKIVFGSEAYMHLHIWTPEWRRQGIGAALVGMAIPYFFRNLALQELYCEPYAHNEAPNRTLQKLGFTFLETYTTIPGYLNFEQPVNRWVLSRAAAGVDGL